MGRNIAHTGHSIVYIVQKRKKKSVHFTRKANAAYLDVNLRKCT